MEVHEKVVAAYLQALRFRGSGEYLDFTCGTGDAAREAAVKVVRFELPCSDGSSLFFTGSVGLVGVRSETGWHDHHFLGLYDSDSLALSELVASAYHFHHRIAPLDDEHTFPLGERSLLRSSGYAAVLVVDASIYAPFANANAVHEQLGLRLHAVLPISEAEWRMKRSDGVDGLFTSWDEEDKDILRVRVAMTD